MKSFLFLLVILVEGCFGYRVVCVYTNWSQYRPPGAKFLPEDVDAKLCTHLIYVYAKLKGNKLEPTEWNDEGSAWSEGMYDRVNNLKQINPEMKTLLGVGGWMMGSKDFSKLASGRISRKLFAKTSVKFLRDRKFDGLAIDWQHPTKRGGKPQDKVNFSLLLKEIRKAFQDDSRKTGLPPLLLTAGVSASREVIEEGYEIDNLTKYTDFLNVMAYDLHGAWDNYTGHPSQLYPREEEFGPPAEINVDSAMRYWMSKVPDRTKLILGVSSYGRTFTLRKTRHNDYNVPTTGPGEAGEFTQQPGMLAYYERCSQYADAKRVWDPVSQVAYWHKGNQWIAGEDVESVKAKVNWTRTYEIGGVMLWSLDTDDFDDMCISELYPLLNAVVTALNDPTFVTRNTSLNDQIMHISSDKNIKSISETKISDNEITPTTTATKIKPTTNITPKTKISETVSSKVVDKAANVNSKIMETKVKANIHENSKVQSLDKDNTLQTRNNQPGSKSDHDTLKSTKSKKVKPKGKRRRMSPKMRRMMFLRRRKQQQNRKKQLKGKGKSDKPNESINKNKRSKAKDDSPTINQRSKNVDNPTDKLQTESNISSSIDVPRENESLTVNRKLNVNTEDNKDKKVFSGKSNQESLIVKEEAKITTIMKLAFNDSSVDENILTKDMLKKGKNKTKVTNGSKITIGKTLRIAPRRKARPVINIKQRHMQLKATTNTKSDKPQGEMNPLNQQNKKLKTNKLSDNFNTHETTTNNILQENDKLKSLSNPTVQKNDRQNGRKIKTGKKKMKLRRKKISKQRKRVKVRRRKHKAKPKTVNWMRHNNIGGIMLSPLDMDDFTGMFCTGDIYPLLISIHNQLLAPLPKHSRPRTNKRPKQVPLGVTKSPTFSTSESVSTFSTTNFSYEFAYETTTELPATTTVNTFLTNQRRNKLHEQIKKAKVKAKANQTHNQNLTKNKVTFQKKQSKKQTATSAYFDSLATGGRKSPNNNVEGVLTGKLIPQSATSTQFGTTVNQAETSTPILTSVSTQAIQVTKTSKESDMRNFLKNAADLPSHSLINGIMKLLGNNGHSDFSGDKRIITTSSDLKVASSTKATTFETTTEAIIRTHLNEPAISIRDLRILAPTHTHNKRHLVQEIRNTGRVIQPFIDNRRDLISGGSVREHLRIQPIRNDLSVRVNQPASGKEVFDTFQKDIQIEPIKQKELVPPPFPLPDMREARPSKSFLDMKDLGFLAK